MQSTPKIYQFTLVLKNVDEHSPGLEDSLFEAGCDDALINFRNGCVYLDFNRKAHSLEEAVISAIAAVESADLGATVLHVAPEDWVTESEVAKRLGKKRQLVSLWMQGKRRTAFPNPVMKLTDKSPLWKWREIVEWLYKHRLVQEPELLVEAKFLEHVNAALEERDGSVRKYRNHLIKKLQLKS